MSEATDFYTIKDLAVILHLGEGKVRKLVAHPNFPKIKIGRQYLIPKDKYKSWVETHLYKEVKI